MVPRAAGQILRDMRICQPGATRLEIHISVSNIRFALAERFDLCAVKHQPGLKLIKNVIVVGGRAILRHDQLFNLISLPGLAIFSRVSAQHSS